ncbi:MAG: hypothetical protein J0H74_12955 [Chitinophagaceae bacterium]|nr:hypothetical protein [Chitinophagaceae bacterium]
MEHNYIAIEEKEGLNRLVLFQKDNNLDGKDNLDMLPESPAVYAVCGRVNGKPANPRYIDATENLRQSVRMHFDRSQSAANECFREFMLSIKTKELVFKMMPGTSEEERAAVREEWEKQYKPECNKELNEIH